MRSLVLAWLLVVCAPAQGSPVLDALETGDVPRALTMLETGAVPDDPDLRMRIVRALANVPRADAELRERALGRAALILPDRVPEPLAASLQNLAGEVGTELARLLVSHDDVLRDGRISDRTHLGAGMAAYQALRLGGKSDSREMLLLGLHLGPLLLAGERPRDAARVATDALGASPLPEHEAALQGVLAQAQLALGRPAEALPYVQRVVQKDPGNARLVLPLVQALPPSMSEETFTMLRDVVKRQPENAAVPAWTECLETFYAAAERLRGKRTTAGLVDGLTRRLPLPQTWHQVLWGEGFRIWLDPDVRPSKIASGKDALILPQPQSAGWRSLHRPPPDLARWQNAAACLQRGEGGPTLVVYWFGPNLEYWYGDSPVERGVTGKTVRGHSAGAIARMVFDVVYDVDAKRRQVRYEARPSLPFAPAENGHRRTFVRGDTVYDENVFSHGQVTVEVLLRATEQELVELEPELRWMYATLRKE